MAVAKDQIRQIITENNITSVADVYSLLKDSFKDILQELLEAEMDATLGYEKNCKGDLKSDNKRNGHSSKTLKSQYGEFQIDVPRDRNGEFEPKLIPKYQRDISGIEEKVISLYARGMSTRDIHDQLQALMEITSKNYQRILEFKLSNHAGRLSASDTGIISQNLKNDKRENSDYYSDKKKVENLQQPYQRIFTPEETQKIIMAYQSGKASYELGTEFNCSKTTIVKLLKQQGITLRKSGRARAKVDDKKVIRMYKEMHTIKEISKNLNVDTQVISRCLKENGVKLRSRWDYPEK